MAFLQEWNEGGVPYGIASRGCKAKSAGGAEMGIGGQPAGWGLDE